MNTFDPFLIFILNFSTVMIYYLCVYVNAHRGTCVYIHTSQFREVTQNLNG